MKGGGQNASLQGVRPHRTGARNFSYNVAVEIALSFATW